MQSRHVAEAIIWGSKFHQWLYTLRIEEAKQIILRNPGVICAVLKLQKNLKTFCKIIVRCGENVGKILYKNGLQVSVGHLRVPGAGIEPARIAPLVFETSASTDSAIWAFASAKLRRIFQPTKFFDQFFCSSAFFVPVLPVID